MSKVSVIVPIYNAEQYLHYCIQSIRTQSYPDIELIEIEDLEGKGAAQARNKGLDRATGDYVCFVDADDILAPFAIETMVEAMSDTDMVIGSFLKFGDFEQVVTHFDEKAAPRQVAWYVMWNLRNPRENQMLSGCWAKLFKRHLCGRFPEISTAEDMAFNFDYLTKCQSVRFLESVVYNNRKRSGSLSTTYDARDKPGLFGFLTGLKYVKTFLSGYYEAEEIDKAIDNSKVYHSMLYFTRICQSQNWTMREGLRNLYP